MIEPKILKNLSCPECRANLNYADSKLICQACGLAYLVKEDLPYLIIQSGKGFIKDNPDVLINKLKVFFKKCPILFDVMHNCFGASRVGLSAKNAIEGLGEDRIILNLGSGTKVKRKDVINVDFYPFANVKIVADIAKLPFKDNSIDAIICEQVLEHLKDPWTVLKEMKRVLRPGALVYITVPFMLGFHSSPNDYYRWTKEGLRELMNSQGFAEEKTGVRHGPTSSLIAIINSWLATILSFDSSKLQQIILMILTVMTFPLKIFDYLLYYFITSENIALGFYYLGKKI